MKSTTHEMHSPSPGEGARGGGRGGQGVRALFSLFLLLLSAVPAAAWDIASDASPASFHAFNQRFSGDAYHYPRHSAAPLGLIGFDIYAEASLDRGFADSAAGDLVNGNLTSGAMSIGRVGVRKGLPGGVDIGVAYGVPLGGSGLKLVSADVQWAMIHGGVLSPAVSLRVTGTGTAGSAGTYDFRQYGAEILVSKGFTVLTPYAGVGVVRSRGTLNAIHGPTLQETDNQGIVYAGLTLSLLIPKITVEVEKAQTVQASVRIGIGL
jgi:hypothetical protein